MSRPALPRPALVLGLAGLVPLVALSALSWLLPAVPAALAVYALIGYGALLLGALGAVHWGLALAGSGAADAGAAMTWPRLGWSVVPPTLGWATLLMPPLPGLAGLCLGFLLAWAVDRRAARVGVMPVWILPLRDLVTAVALLSLGGALLRYLV